MMPAEENNNHTPKSTLRRIWDPTYEFVETYGLDFTSVIIAALGLILYEISYIEPEAIGRWTLLALLGISISNMGNRGSRLKDIQKKTEESMNLVRRHLANDVLKQNLSRGIDEHLGKVDKCNAVGITEIFEGFDAGKFRERSRTAKRSIRILDIWIGQLDGITRSLREAASRGVSIQILLLNPNSKQAWYRMRDLSTKPGDTLPQQARNIIKNELERLFALCQDSEVKNNIDVRVYDALPTACIYGFDDANIVGTYWRGLSNIESTQLAVVVPSPDFNPPIAESVHNHFTDLWNNVSEKVTNELLQADSQDASSTPAVDVLPQVIKQGTEKYKEEPARMSEFVRRQVRKLSELEAVMPVPDPPNLSGHNILWVDDFPINNAFESHMLEKLGIDITQVSSTEEARGFLRHSNLIPRRGGQNGFDLIVSDLNREEQGANNPNAGAELFDQIQQDEDLSLYRDVPFIFYSDSIARLDGDRKARAYGATDKPNELIERVTYAVQGIELDEESA